MRATLADAIPVLLRSDSLLARTCRLRPTLTRETHCSIRFQQIQFLRHPNPTVNVQSDGFKDKDFVTYFYHTASHPSGLFINTVVD